MRVVDGPLDDTVQLEPMEGDSDSRNMANFPPSDDTVRILPDSTEDFDEREVTERAAMDQDRPPPSHGTDVTVIFSTAGRPLSLTQKRITVAIMASINFINYADRFTYAGKLTSLFRIYKLKVSTHEVARVFFF